MPRAHRRAAPQNCKPRLPQFCRAKTHGAGCGISMRRAAELRLKRPPRLPTYRCTSHLISLEDPAIAPFTARVFQTGCFE